MLCAAVAAGLAVSGSACAAELRAGAARVDVTPPASAFPLSAPPEKDFVGIHDPVYARALVLDDGAHRTAIVGLDLAIVPEGERVVRAVAQAAGVAPGAVMVFATHSHNNPLVFYHGHDATPAQQREIDRVIAGAASAAKEAASRLEPARIAFARGKAFVNVNNGEEAGLPTPPDPTGPSDKTLDVVRVTTPGGQPIALMVNYASHAEVMFRSVTKAGGYEVSGDLPGAAARLLEGPKGAPVVLFSPAAEADQLSLFRSLNPPTAGLPASDLGAGGWALLDAQARQLTASVLATLAKAPAGAADAAIRTATKTAACPAKDLQIDHDNGKATAGGQAMVEIPLSVVRVGGLTLAGVGGDVGSAIGGKARAALKGQDAMVVTMLAGSIGYILPDSAYVHPGHGVAGSSLKAGCAETAVVAGLVELAARK